ncbi:MAG: flagellar assembly protein FliW [Candidatus Muiribacterium halophilum]|uniref:Flagellar assembly factor FliW n=1 Tax=Muiribacterium halophilum TaxID=2053465 RepID=A0A2N5ZJ50_MUIH1|nr:MAG: flagellar assembly protein FliW [Candidatus Muirbacterium halophilum]
MKLKTSRFGEIDIKPEEIYRFKNGIFGFENFRKFVLLKEDEGIFVWLQSIENGELAFVLINPMDFYYEYILDIDQNDAKDLQIKEDSKTEIFAIVVIPDDVNKMTANLQGPIVFNHTEKVAKQVISVNPEHHLKHKILEEMQNKSKMENNDSGEDND